MNILHIVYAKMWGGGEQYVYNCCREENRLGHKNWVIMDAKHQKALSKLAQVAEIEKVSLGGVGRIFAVKECLRVIDAHQIQVLNCHSGTMSLLCAVLKKLRPSLILLQYRHNVTPNKKDFYHRWLQSKVDAFICVSKLVYDLQIKTAYAQNTAKFHLIYNGIDEDRFSYRADHQPGDVFQIGYAGRLVENKGIRVLLEALKILKEKYALSCYLQLAGGGDKSFLDKCKKFTAQNGLDAYCRYLDFVEDMPAFYAGLDVFVLPSIARESFGFVLCEAMYSGVPVISTDSGAQGEIVQEGIDGFLVPAQNSHALAEKIAYLARHPQNYTLMARHGHERVKNHFTLSVMVKQINQLINKLQTQ